MQVKFGQKLTQKIFRQLDDETAAMLDLIAFILNNIMIFVLVPMMLLAGMGGRLLPTWMFVNSLQLISYTPLL